MKFDDLMSKNGGTWENDVATVRNGAYLVRVAERRGGVVTVTDEGLRSFPELGGTHKKAVAPVVEEPVVEEPVVEPVVEPEHKDKTAKLQKKKPLDEIFE